MADAKSWFNSPAMAVVTAGVAGVAIYMLGRMTATNQRREFEYEQMAQELRAAQRGHAQRRRRRKRGNHQSSQGEWSPLDGSTPAHSADEDERDRRRGSARGPSKISQEGGSVLSQKVAKEVIDRGLEGEWQGFSMEDARKHNDITATKAAARSPHDVLRELQRGNARFWMGVSTRPEVSAFERRALIMQQYPAVAILGCSDSRVPIEIVFDQGLGDMFVIRVAGNCLDTTTTASLEYAVQHLHVKLIVVMGHEGCGAVKAAQLSRKEIEQEPRHLSEMLTKMKAGLDESRLRHVFDPRARDRETVVTNVRAQLDRLTEDQSIMSKVQSEELVVVGAFYEISSGIVDFFDEISKDDLDSASAAMAAAGTTDGSESEGAGSARLPRRMTSNARYVGASRHRTKSQSSMSSDAPQ